MIVSHDLTIVAMIVNASIVVKVVMAILALASMFSWTYIFMKMFAIRLVLAALIADSETTGRVLILDELGNSLGDVNRRDVLRSLSRVAEREQFTILGTCQDSVLSDAADTDAGDFSSTPTARVRVSLGDLTQASGSQTVQFAVTIN